jgi:hypothetical protein
MKLYDKATVFKVEQSPAFKQALLEICKAKKIDTRPYTYSSSYWHSDKRKENDQWKNERLKCKLPSNSGELLDKVFDK